MFVILPVPHEATTSYGKGTKNGPKAILDALTHVEEFDEELRVEIRPGVEYIVASRQLRVGGLQSAVASLLAEKKVPIILGGEHSLTPYAVKACQQRFPDLSVLQLDAHADLRDSYQGRKDSHACVLRRVLEICPAVQVGIRSFSKEEWDWANQTGQIKKIYPINGNIINNLSKNVYLTIDVDVFDPSIMPATGTPEPGGLLWKEVIALLQQVCREKNIVGFDIVELAPRKGDLASDFTAAKLAWKLMGLLKARKS
jgi:agmatinase